MARRELDERLVALRIALRNEANRCWHVARGLEQNPATIRDDAAMLNQPIAEFVSELGNRLERHANSLSPAGENRD